jgi:PAS domain S-box-containing protein
MKHLLQRSRFWLGTPLLVLAVGLAATALASVYLQSTISRRELDRFHREADQVARTLEYRISVYAAALRGFAALFAANEVVTRQQFTRFAQRTRVTEVYPGIQGLGFALWIPPGMRAAELQRIRTQDAPSFQVWPDTGDEGIGTILFLEPPDERNRHAMGFDMYSEAARREAMQRAVDEFAPVATARVKLVQEIDDQPQQGFLIYLPVLRTHARTDTVVARRGAVMGWVYSPFRIGDLMTSIFPPGGLDVWVDIYDGADLRPDLLMHRDAGSRDDAPAFVTSRAVEIAGRRWLLEIGPRPSFTPESGRQLVPMTFLSGLGVSLLLTGATASLARSRSRSIEIARQLRKSQQKLERSEVRFRRLFESNLLGIAFGDTSGRIVEANGEALRMIGRSREQATAGDFSWRRVTAPERRTEDERAIHQLHETGVAQPYETEFLRPDGYRTPALVGMAMLQDSETQLVLLLVDLSERKQFEIELQAARDAAVDANRAKDQFLAVLSHELRTPLTPALALAAAGASNPELPEPVRDDFDTIRRNIQLESKLIEDLLDLTKIGRGKLQIREETVDLHRVIQAAVQVTSRAAIELKRLNVRVQLEAGRHHVSGDAARLQQIFWNLLQNAVKFTPVDGLIVLRTRNLPASDPKVATGELIEVLVSDTGIGLPPEALQRIFEAFQQVHPSSRELGGLGLGLAISKGLVEAHDGTISATSEGVGRGATFTVRLATTAAPLPTSDPGVGEPPAHQVPASASILLVEDHVDTANVLSRLLRRAGYQVRTAHSVTDALQRLQEHSPDLLISDIGLPDGNGCDVVRAHARRAGGPVAAIALTGFGMDDDIAATRQAGFSAHVTKPVQFQQLRETIESLLADGPQPTTAGEMTET